MGAAKAVKKEGRIAAEGVVDIMVEGNSAVIVEVNIETDFAAKSAPFREFVTGLMQTILATRPADVDALKACTYFGTNDTVETILQDRIGTISEKISIRRFQIVDGTVASYIHGSGETGVIISFDTDVASDARFVEAAKNVALQVAAIPCRFVNRESVPASVIEEEKNILLAQLANDEKFASKPEKVKEGIVTGKIGKFYEENCLTEQAYVKDDSLSVGKFIAGVAKEIGGNIAITGFIRFDKGEGIEKKEENFAEEIAKMVNG
jgi:elongation factor Ts